MGELQHSRESSDHYRLCFVKESWAYFVNGDPTEVWGDDWNDAPHDCNAGPPYGTAGQAMEVVAFDGDLEVVGTAMNGVGAGRWGWLSVEEINAGAAPWLVQLRYGARSDDDLIPLGVTIPAGVTLAEFRKLVREACGYVYERRSDGA